MPDDNREKILAMMRAKLGKKGASSSAPKRPPSTRSHAKLAIPEAAEVEGKILLMIPDKRLRLVLTNQFKTKHLECIDTDNGMEAVMFAQSEKPDVIIVEEVGGEGLKTCMQIRELPEGFDIPILLLSAPLKPDQKRLAVDSNVSGFFTMPPKMPELMKTIHELLQKQDFDPGTDDG